MQPVEQSNLDKLSAYTAVIEHGPASPTTTAWTGTDAMQIHARLAQGQSLVAPVTYDPARHAYTGGRPLRVHRDPAADFNVIDVPPGEHDIRFVFETPLEKRIGWLFTWLPLAIAGALPASSPIMRMSQRH